MYYKSKIEGLRHHRYNVGANDGYILIYNIGKKTSKYNSHNFAKIFHSQLANLLFFIVILMNKL